MAAQSPQVDDTGAKPYLRLFDEKEGARECSIQPVPFLIGRSPDAGLCLPHVSISREHARIDRVGSDLCLVDLKSASGVFLNRERMPAETPTPLKTGDIIQIVEYVLEFRIGTPRTLQVETICTTVPRTRMNASVRTQMFLDRFRYLPAGMEVQYRILQVQPGSVFHVGDTLQLGEGGLLLATRRPVPRVDRIIEVEIRWPDGKKKRLLTEMLGVVPEGEVTLMGLKLHQLGPDRYEQVIAHAQRSEWYPTEPPRT